MNYDILDIDRQLRLKLSDTNKIPGYHSEISRLEEIVKNGYSSEKVKEDLIYRIEYLKLEINKIQSQTDLNFYIMESSMLIEKYRELLSKPVKVSFFGKKVDNTLDIKERVDLIQAYISIVKKYDKNFNTSILGKPSVDVTCPVCKFSTEFDVFDNQISICINCGNQTDVSSDISSFKDANRINISSKYTYERRVHFRDCINQFQSKQNSNIPDSVFNSVENQLQSHGLLNNLESGILARFSRITREHIYLFLKETGNSKYYEDTFLIHYKLTGKPRNDISHLEQKLVEDFDVLTALYDKKFKYDKKIERKSFINTQYVLFQLLRRHKYPCRKEDFNILKTLDRKSFHDDICKELFEELGWNFTPSF
jgi:hypothetical protein